MTLLHVEVWEKLPSTPHSEDSNKLQIPQELENVCYLPYIHYLAVQW